MQAILLIFFFFHLSFYLTESPIHCQLVCRVKQCLQSLCSLQISHEAFSFSQDLRSFYLSAAILLIFFFSCLSLYLKGSPYYLSHHQLACQVKQCFHYNLSVLSSHPQFHTQNFKILKFLFIYYHPTHHTVFPFDQQWLQQTNGVMPCSVKTPAAKGSHFPPLSNPEIPL
jgi:hypothetical protein